MSVEDSGFGRLLGALISPARTFRAIAERPTWVWPLLLLTVVATAMIFLAYQKVDPAAIAQQQIAQVEKSSGQAATDQQVAMFEKLSTFMVWIGSLGALFGTPIFYLLGALVLWALLRFTAGSEISFGQSFSTLLHGMLPSAVAGLLTLLVILGRREITFDEVQHLSLLKSNLAAFAPEGTGPAALALLGSVDFFSLWSIVLLILGYRTVARVRTGLAAAVVLVPWLLLVAIKVAISLFTAGH
jgi:hypothetical protein